MIIGVIGGEQADDDASSLAFEVGARIGRSGHMLITGGRGGVMRAACEGAKSTGGTTIAILPGDDLFDANEFVDIPIITGLGFARNTIITRTANALVAIDGMYGTLSEIAFALISGTPVIGLGTWEMRSGHGLEAPVIRASTAAEAVAAALDHARPHPGQRA